MIYPIVKFGDPVLERKAAHITLFDEDLRRLVDDVVMLASPEMARHNVHIERDITSEPLPVRIDADLVKQAVLNIVINGVQAMPEGGALHISARMEGDNAVLTVRDEGPGIPAEIRDKIYNLYFTTKKGGSGIGLAMTYRVVQLHNGSLEFDSVQGHGATFYLRFPMAENAVVGEPPRVASEDSVVGH